MLKHQIDPPCSPRRVVIMGAGGFVGGAIEKALKARDVDILALGRKDIDLMADAAADQLADLLLEGDTFVAVSAQAPVKNIRMLEDNIVMARNMVAALQKKPVSHVINISSDAVYGDDTVPLTESAPRAPGSYHGVMHLVRELMFETELDCPLAMLRPTLIFGANDPHNGYGPNRFRRLVAAGEDIVLFGKGEERRDHVHVDDVGQIAAETIFNKSSGALNVATGDVVSFKEIAEKAVAMGSAQVNIVETERTGPMPHNGYRPFDISACAQAFPNFKFASLAEWLAEPITMDELA